MNKIQIDLSPGQSSKLRNGHSIRISPKMIGLGVDMIIDTMTMNNMFKKLDKGKGIVMGLSKQEINENKISGSGLFGSGNKSGKISRTKKAYKWKDFANETARDGIDLASYGYKEYQKAKILLVLKLNLGLVVEIWKWMVEMSLQMLKNPTIKILKTLN